MPSSDSDDDELVAVVVGVDEYGEPRWVKVPRHVRGQWDSRAWSDRPPQ